MEKTYEVWCEGYKTPKSDGTHFFVGKQKGKTFQEACISLAQEKCLGKNFDADTLTYWGSRLFETREAAAKAFG